MTARPYYHYAVQTITHNNANRNVFAFRGMVSRDAWVAESPDTRQAVPARDLTPYERAGAVYALARRTSLTAIATASTEALLHELSLRGELDVWTDMDGTVRQGHGPK